VGLDSRARDCNKWHFGISYFEAGRPAAHEEQLKLRLSKEQFNSIFLWCLFNTAFVDLKGQSTGSRARPTYGGLCRFSSRTVDD